MLEELIKSPYFGIGCCIAAFFLYKTSIVERRPVLMVLLVEFVLCKIASFVGIRLTSIMDGWQMYFVYFAIQVGAIYSLLFITGLGVNGSLIVALLISFAAIYNALMIAPYFKYTVFGVSGDIMYNIYSYLLAFIMILQLIYMSLFNKYVFRGLGKYARTYTMFVDRVNFSGSLAAIADLLLPKRA